MYDAPPFAGEIDLRSRHMVQLNAVSIGLVGWRQRQAHRRVLLVAEVEEHHVVADLAGAEGQQISGGELSDEGVGLQAVTEGHGESPPARICDGSQRNTRAVPVPMESERDSRFLI